jgi:TamB, inner membrane protein subunit of TAM complex
LNTLKKRTKLIKKSIGKLLKWLSVATLGLLISTFIVLQFSCVQNRLFGILLQHLSHTTHFAITHHHFQLKWLYRVSLTGLTIKDPQDNIMLAMDQLTLKVNPLQLLTNMHMTLKTVCVRGAQVHLCKEDAAGYNMHVLLQRLVRATKLASSTHHDHAASLMIDKAYLHDITLSVDDRQALPLQDGFDIQHLTLHKMDAELANLKAQAGTLAVDICHFTGKHADRPLLVDHFRTSLLVAPDGVEFKALQLRTGCSTLEGSCALTYDLSLPPAAFKDNVHVTAHLSSAVIAAEELAVFLPYFKQHKASYSLSGALEGKVNDFRVKDLQFDFGEQGSRFEGCLSLQGLPNLQEATFDIELQQGVLHTKDLLPYLDAKHYKRIEKFNLVKPQGHFCGRLNDFIIKAAFDTELGKVTTDLKVQINLAAQRTTYKGAITTSSFELGAWLNNATMQQLTMQGHIDGEGLSWATAHFQLEANIHKLGFNNYTYENIHAHGHFSRAIFQGMFTVDDPHLQLRADAAINFNRGTENIAVEGILDRACLQGLQLTDRRVTLCTQLSVVIEGLSLDSIKTDAKLHQFCFDLEGKEIRLDTLHIRADQGDFGHVLEVDSALLALKAEGDFSYTSLVSDFKRFIQGYQHRLMHVGLPPQRHTLQPYTLAYQLHCKDINPLFRVLGIEAHVSPNTLLEGSFSQQERANFSLRLAEAATFSFKKNRWEGTQLELSTSQSKDGQSVSAVVQLASKGQQWGTLNATEDLSVAIFWKDNQIDFRSSLVLHEGLQQASLAGQAVLLDSTIEVVLTPAQGVLPDSQWQVHPENRMTLGKSWTRFQNFTFRKGQQQVSLEGTLSADPAEVLHLKVKDCSLENFDLLVSKPVTGVLNAAAILQGTLDQPYINSDITLEKLTIDHFLVGDIHVKTSWNNILQRLNMTCQLAYLKKQTVVIQGCYEPLKEANSLQLTTHFSHAPLAALAPFVANHLSQLAGELNGTIYINGSPSSPQMTGGATITEAAVRVNYCNTLYQVSGALTFADQMIHITTLHLSDDQQGKAVLQGSIAHKGFEDFQVDATGSMKNFRLLNTAEKDHEYFYGTGILSGGLTASGPVNNMVVCLKAKTDPGTHIFIPVCGASHTVAQYDFIRFVNFKARYQDKAAQTKQVVLQGFKLVLLLEITPDAHTVLILDEKAGDAIKGQGKGNIKLEVDTEGVLTMAGGFEFLAGEYNLSLYRIINRIFKILPESKITWYDNPAQGILNIKAAYEQRVALAPLLRGAGAAVRAQKKYPVQVVIGLQGALLSPKKSFAINFPECPSELATAVNEFKRKAKEDKKYAETQALGLLLFREFSDRKIIDTGNNTVGRHFSALASQQLSNFTSNLDDNLEVDVEVDLAALGNKDLDNLHLNLSYHLVNGRLRVSRRGSIFGNTARAWGTAQWVGDWTVEYVLTKDGRLSAKLYNKHVTNTSYVDTESAATFTGGVSLSYTKGFNQWWELLRSSKRVAKKEATQNDTAH